MIEKFKESLEFRCNVGYIVAQGLYWMIVCCCISLGNAYLSNKGFTPVSIGFLFAFAYLFAALIQQVVSILIDKSPRKTAIDALFIFGVVLACDLILAIGSKESGFIAGLTFLIGAMVATIMQPFLNSLNFYMEDHGIKMNFGVARASGSFCFFVMSLLAGNLMKRLSPNVAPCLGFICTVLFIAAIFWIFLLLKQTGEGVNAFDPVEVNSSEEFFDIKSVKRFVAKNKMFFIFLVGIVCFIFGHLLINTFIYEITTTVGGDEADNGGLIAFAALVELPVMIFFNKLKDIFKTKNLLAVSAVFFFIKIFFTSIANSVGMLYFSMVFQAFAFALFIPAAVHYADEVLDSKDAVKGQAFITIAITISNLISSLLGGLIIGALNIKAALVFGSVVTFFGVIISIWGLYGTNSSLDN